MAFTRAADGVRLHYEVVGRPTGEPVLMIQGLGADKKGWILQRLALAPRYRTIALDNRGVGRSDKPTGRYDLEQMADDALAVLDAAGYESAHVMGASMGGVISQIIAVRHPERVRSLVLACTACHHHPWRRELLADWARVAQEQGMNAFMPRAMRWLVGPRSFRRFLPAVPLVGPVVGPLALNCPSHAFVSQVRAILDMDDSVRAELHEVRVPTLVLVGSQDILTPQGDSEEIAELVPGAELVVISGAAHGFMLEHAGSFNRALLDFLGRAAGATAGGEATQPRTA